MEVAWPVISVNNPTNHSALKHSSQDTQSMEHFNNTVSQRPHTSRVFQRNAISKLSPPSSALVLPSTKALKNLEFAQVKL